MMCHMCDDIKKMELKFEAKSARVKGIAFHPSKPWIITSLHTGHIQIWDYNMNISVGKFDGHDGPIRGIDFHPQLPLFVSGGDDGMVKVWDSKQKRCNFTLQGHIDYVRSTYFHHELPWILSASDDQTIRIWNYQSRGCVNIITGHSHYVMCAQFHPQKNLIVSGSLDSTVRIWDFTVLRKKLTQTKNQSTFIGVEIECLKVLDGHQRGVNWVCFHPSTNMIASCSDDRKIKLWKYTNQVAWEHSTITGHRNNVSSVTFHQTSGYLISNSEDKTIKLWNFQTKTAVQTQKRQNDRYWMVRLSKNGNLLAGGHDSGLQIWQINRQIVPFAFIGENLLVFAKGMKTMLHDIQKNVQKQQLYQYTPKDKNALVLISKLTSNTFDSLVFMVQVQENGEKFFQIKKKESYLNYPNMLKSYSAMDSCFISANQVAILVSSHIIHLQKIQGQDKKQVLRLNQDIKVLRIFSSQTQNQLIVVTVESILKYNLQGGRVIGQIAVQQNANITNVVVGKERIAIFGQHIIFIANHTFDEVVTVTQSFSIQSTFWERQNLLFYTTKNHWKYALMNGQTGVLRTLDRPLHLIKKIADRKFLAFNQTQKMFELECPSYLDIQFKLAVQAKEWTLAQSMVKNKQGKQKKNLIGYLVSKGHAAAAVDMAQSPQQRFALAVQATNFQLAFETCSQINSQQHWRLLGEEALKQGIYQAYELASQKQKQYDKLNFLYSLQNNKPKLQKMTKLASKLNNPILAYNAALFINNSDEKQQILRDCGLEALAELAGQAASDDLPARLSSLGSRPLQPIQPQGELDFSNWPHNILEQQEEGEAES